MLGLGGDDEKEVGNAPADGTTFGPGTPDDPPAVYKVESPLAEPLQAVPCGGCEGRGGEGRGRERLKVVGKLCRSIGVGQVLAAGLPLVSVDGALAGVATPDAARACITGTIPVWLSRASGRSCCATQVTFAAIAAEIRAAG